LLIKIYVDAWEAQDALEAIEDILSSSQLGSAAGSFAAGRIVERTLAGRDVNDSYFAPYAPGTRKFGTPNLYETGEMLGSVGYFPAGSSGANVSCGSEIAKYHQGGTRKMPQRKFMGLSHTDKIDLLDEVFSNPLKEVTS